jgi:hypothetical protein
MGRADFCLPWTEMLQMSTQSIHFLTASGVRSQGKLKRIQDPTTGMALGECYIVYDIDSEILLFDIERFIFDIEREKDLRYRIRYQSTISNHFVRCRRDETSISTTLFVTFDIDEFGHSISSKVSFDIEYRRYRL